MLIDLKEYLTQEAPAPEWLVPGILTRDAMIILAGDPGVGKSVLCYSLSMALAIGGRFLGRDVPQGRVLYFDEENSRPDLRAYLHLLWQGAERPAPETLASNIRLEHFSLISVDGKPYDVMRRLANTDEWRPDLIVIDTATPICRIEDENSNSEASAAIRELRRVRPAGCTMLIIKHARVDGQTGKRDIRGAKAWKGECDGVIFHTLAAGRPPKDKWRKTQLEPGKVRAYGLRDTLPINPVEAHGGLVLTTPNTPPAGSNIISLDAARKLTKPQGPKNE